MINLARRSFLFGASVALVVPPVRTFYLPPKQPLVATGIYVNALTGMMYEIISITPSTENGWCDRAYKPLKWMVEV